jgi:hypothetical protein
VTCSTKLRRRKATTITDMYAALDLGQRTIQAVLKREDGKIIKEIKTRKQADTILQFLKGTHANFRLRPSSGNGQYPLAVYHMINA